MGFSILYFKPRGRGGGAREVASQSPSEEECTYGWSGGMKRCGECGATEEVQVCSGCRAVAYCGPRCQEAAWRGGHGAECGEQGSSGEVQGRGRGKRVKEVQGPMVTQAKRSKRSVCINSQPQFAPSQQEAREREGEVEPPRSILKGAPPSAGAGENVAPFGTKKNAGDAAGAGVEEGPEAAPSPPPDPNHLQDLPSPSPSTSSGGTASPISISTPPNSPSLVSSVRRGSEARPTLRRSTPHPRARGEGEGEDEESEQAPKKLDFSEVKEEENAREGEAKGEVEEGKETPQEDEEEGDDSSSDEEEEGEDTPPEDEEDEVGTPQERVREGERFIAGPVYMEGDPALEQEGKEGSTALEQEGEEGSTALEQEGEEGSTALEQEGEQGSTALEQEGKEGSGTAPSSSDVVSQQVRTDNPVIMWFSY